MLNPPKTLLEAAQAVREGRISSLELVNHALEVAEAQADLNLFAFLDTEGARARAAQLDQAFEAGEVQGPLHGVPITVKDLFNVTGMPTQAGTRAPLPEAFKNPRAPTHSAVARLERAGAVILGKVNMHEIALGITGENVWTGDVKNPRDPTRQTGGSSSGSAAAVAAGVGFASLGSDTGGSIRIPASFCGCMGFKPSFGIVPLEGALHLSPTCDHAGPLTPTVLDAHAVFEVLADKPCKLERQDELRDLRLGVPRAYLHGRLGTAVREAFEGLLERLRVAGAEVVDLDPEALEQSAEAYGPIVRAEAAFVHRAALETHVDGFSRIVRWMLEDGSRIALPEYLLAREHRAQVSTGLEHALATVDAMILPAAPLPAPVRGTSEVTLESGPKNHRSAFIELTYPFSMVGVPALSLPFAWFDGLPVGLQVIAQHGEDARVLEIGLLLEAFLAG